MQAMGNPTEPQSALEALLPPPEAVEEINVPWDASTAQLGIVFPQDYRRFVEAYGSGSIAGDLAVIVPWRTGGPPYLPELEEFGLFRVRAEKMSSLNHFHDSAPERWPYPFWPERGGALAWARNRRYGYLLWLTDGEDSDRWPCVSWNQFEWRLYQCTMVELLLRLLSGKDEFLNGFVKGDNAGPMDWQPNVRWPRALPEALRIDDDDDWSIPAASAERGEPDPYRQMRA